MISEISLDNHLLEVKSDYSSWGESNYSQIIDDEITNINW